MQNPHELREELKNILDVQIGYHRERLMQFQKRQDRLTAERAGKQPFSLARTISGMGNGSLHDADHELLKTAAAFAGLNFDQQRAFIPWGLLLPPREREKRDLTVANAGSAGYLVAASVGSAMDVLRGWSVAVSAGITSIDGLVGSLAIPRITTPPTGYALPTEATPITESQPVIGQALLDPKSLACFIEFSRLLTKQANAETVIRMIMLSTLGKFLDQQILNGTGAAGELQGLFNIAGTQTQSGTALAHAGVTTMKKLAGEAGAADQELGFVSTPAVRQLLENREKATGNGGFVWDGGKLADLPAFASNECPTASMICGPWSQVILGHWGPPGLTLEINPYDPTGFKKGVIQGRMIITVDAAAITPGAFVKATSIT